MNSRVLFITKGALIAALYAAVTVVFAPISYGPIQFRVSEALTVLPWIFVEAVPGLFIGCLFANVFGGYGIIDIVLGSAATLLAALATRTARNKIAAVSAPVIANGLIVGLYLSYLVDMNPLLSILYVAAGEAMVCYGLGLPLLKILENKKFR